MKELFVPYRESLELKELGFEEPCFGHYDDSKLSIYWADADEISNLSIHQSGNDITNYECLAPLFSQIFKWFRDKYSWIHIINPYKFTAEIWFLDEKVINEKYGDFIPHRHLVDDEGEEISHSSYEEAELGCIRELIEILKNKKDESKDNS